MLQKIMNTRKSTALEGVPVNAIVILCIFLQKFTPFQVIIRFCKCYKLQDALLGHD